MKTHTSVVIALTCLFTGCAADRQARSTASVIEGDMVSYEKSVDLKVAAEKAFYHSQIDRLRGVLGGAHLAVEKAATVAPADSHPTVWGVDVRKTVPYLRIRTTATRDAQTAASQILTAEKPDPRTVVSSYLTKGLTDDEASTLSAIARQRDLAETLESNLRQIDQQKTALKGIREDISTLSKDPSTFDQLKELATFGKAVSDEIKKK